jgi:hypothetical protein
MQSAPSSADPILLSSVDSEDFPKSWYELADEDHFWCRWRLEAFRRQLASLAIHTDAPLKGIEIGCGNGLVRRQLEGVTNWEVDGADIDLDALRMNQTLRGQSFLYDIHERRTEMEAAYDFIVLFDVLEHIEGSETQHFLESCSFHLKPGGKIFVNVPAMESLRSKYDEIAGHYFRYSKGLLTSQLTAAGFQADDVRYWGFSLVLIAYLRKLVVRSETDADKIIEKGFRPPSSVINGLLSLMGRIETSILRRPWRGTSLLWVGCKNS